MLMSWPYARNVPPLFLQSSTGHGPTIPMMRSQVASPLGILKSLSLSSSSLICPVRTIISIKQNYGRTWLEVPLLSINLLVQASLVSRAWFGHSLIVLLESCRHLSFSHFFYSSHLITCHHVPPDSSIHGWESLQSGPNSSQ